MELDVMDPFGRWYDARVVQLTPDKVMFDYVVWPELAYREELPRDSPRIRALGDVTRWCLPLGGTLNRDGHITTVAKRRGHSIITHEGESVYWAPMGAATARQLLGLRRSDDLQVGMMLRSHNHELVRVERMTDDKVEVVVIESHNVFPAERQIREWPRDAALSHLAPAFCHYI
jgi:hypothetical protein